MTVSNELTCLFTAVSKTYSIYNIVKTTLKKTEKIFTGYTLSVISLFKVTLELILKNTVISLRLLFLTELKSVFLYILSSGTMLTGNGRTLFNCALTGKATVTFKK